MKSNLFKKLTAGALALLMVGTALPSGSDFTGLFGGSVMSASAQTTSGECGENATWEFDSETGKLTISGTGAMYDYDSTDMPWYENRHDITSIEIGEGITAIGAWAFANSSNAASVVIPSSVTTIGEGAFASSSLTSIDIPESVTSIGKDAFYKCKFTTVTIPSSVTVINEQVFQGCKLLESVVIPQGVTSIGGSAFAGCKSLKTAALPEGVTSIGENTFRNCESLKTVIIPSTVTSIDDCAFNGCRAVDDVFLWVNDPTKLTWSDDSGSFKVDMGTRCHVPSGTADDYRSKFDEYDYNVTFVDDLENCKCGDSAYWSLTDTDDDGKPDKLTISGIGAMWDFNTDTNIMPWYEYINDIKSVEIADGITQIGDHALRNCSALTSVTIPDSVTEIGDFAFYSSELIEDVALPGKLTSIGEGAFAYCSSLKNISIPKSVTTIGNMAFSFCSTLEDLSFADESELETIGEYAFSGCEKLESVTIPAGVTSIGEDAFFGCTSCTDVYCLVADPTKLEWTDGSFDDFIYDEDDPDTHKVTKCHVAKGKLDAFNTKFSDVNVTFVDDLVDMGIGAHLYGHSLSLDGDIGVNFYMELDTAVAESDTAYMLFTVSKNDGTTETKKVYVKEVLDKTATVGDKTYYQFKCRVAAKDMTAEITAQMHDGDTAGEEYTYSVKEYAAKILESPETYFPDEDKRSKGVALVKAMLNYGSYAQIYFDPEIDYIDDYRVACYDLGTNPWKVDDVTALTISAALNKKTPHVVVPDGVTFEGATLSLKSETTLSLYFKNPDNVQFDVTPGVLNPDGTYIETDPSGDYTIVRIRGISAKDLNYEMRILINCTGQDVYYSVGYKPLYYCQRVLESDTTSDELKNVSKALFCYWQAANDYFGD